MVPFLSSSEAWRHERCASLEQFLAMIVAETGPARKAAERAAQETAGKPEHIPGVVQSGAVLPVAVPLGADPVRVGFSDRAMCH